MLTAFLFLAVCFLAYANGANDNFKGVATLYGSGTTDYNRAIRWGTFCTLLGSAASILLARALLKSFSGKGLVPDALVGSPEFLAAVAVGAGLTVLLATATGFPISTTHGLVGGLVGSGLMAAGGAVRGDVLATTFLVPLLVSPLAALFLGAALYVVFRHFRLRLGVTKETCVCVGARTRTYPVPQPAHAFSREPVLPEVQVSLARGGDCEQRYVGRVLGINAQDLLDGFHYFSAGVVSFARGLNDTPKIAALLVIVQILDIGWGLLAVAATMAAGGLLGARKVGETMGHRITDMNRGQAVSANLATGLLVIVASRLGMPVSTTHVSVGSLFGIGAVTGQAHGASVRNIVLSWVVTLPCAAVAAAATYALLDRV